MPIKPKIKSLFKFRRGLFIPGSRSILSAIKSEAKESPESEPS
jgi:hypothetical protein